MIALARITFVAWVALVLSGLTVRSQPIESSAPWRMATSPDPTAVSLCIEAEKQADPGAAQTSNHARQSVYWWCEAPRGYYPSVPMCSTSWRSVSLCSPAPRPDALHTVGATNQPKTITRFDCTKATTFVERVICADSELAQWDSRMGQTLKLKLFQLVDGERGALIEDQRRWVAWRIGQCERPHAISVKSCVLQLTKARIATLAAGTAISGQTSSRGKSASNLPATTRHVDSLPKNHSFTRHVTGAPKDRAVARPANITPKDHAATQRVTIKPKDSALLRRVPVTAKSGARSKEQGDTSSRGNASYYDRDSQTASGEKFDPNQLTAAHPTLPFGTRVRVTNMTNGRSVTVRVNDRGPFVRGRIVDVSSSAAEALRMTEPGVVKVKLDIVH